MPVCFVNVCLLLLLLFVFLLAALSERIKMYIMMASLHSSDKIRFLCLLFRELGDVEK